MKKYAFTLAEVLITLGIIGVVAAMTIPTLMQNTNAKDVVAKVKKANNTITNAINLGAAHEGLTAESYYKGDDGHLYFKSFIKNTNVIKKPDGYEDTDEYYEGLTWKNQSFYLSDGTKWSMNNEGSETHRRPHRQRWHPSRSWCLPWSWQLSYGQGSSWW